jgi:GT2 family glycosyltransferase
MGTTKTINWKEGDLCLALWREEYRLFRIVTLRNNSAYLHAASRQEGERITPRTIRNLELLKPLDAKTEKKMIFLLILRIIVLVIFLAALTGVILWGFFPDKMKDK